MNEEFILAGKITARVREESRKWIVKGAKYTNIADKIEDRIKELGARPAFPVNISVNDKAAHDTARPEDERELKSGDVVKIDLGAHVNGWLGDSAYTIEVETEKYKELINASKEALNNALAIVNKKTKLYEIGKIIEATIMKKGYQPIRNLCGHPLNQWEMHGEFIIPNYDNNSKQELGEGKYAIEPFATNGEGWVINDNETLIYNLENKRPTSKRHTKTRRQILRHTAICRALDSKRNKTLRVRTKKPTTRRHNARVQRAKRKKQRNSSTKRTLNTNKRKNNSHNNLSKFKSDTPQ